MPHGVIVDPIFKSPQSGEILTYTRCGDAANWTGHFLAAESYRFALTGHWKAREHVYRAVSGIRQLVDATGADLLARCIFPADSPYAASFASEERHNGVYEGTVDGRKCFWVGRTSRDQYSGVFFGLSVAYEVAPDAGLRASIRWLAGRLLGSLLKNDWAVVMPDGDISTVFTFRPDQQLALLQVGRQTDPQRFERAYVELAAAAADTPGTILFFEALDTHNSYFKFNLDYINMFSLIRLEPDPDLASRYKSAYDVLRGATEGHDNAHFNLIDRALNGPEFRRDRATVQLLENWLKRPRRDYWVDLCGKYVPCFQSDRACRVIPVLERVNSDFLWQRSPFLLYGGGSCLIEAPGIDYFLPYWMARYYGVL